MIAEKLQSSTSESDLLVAHPRVLFERGDGILARLKSSRETLAKKGKANRYVIKSLVRSAAFRVLLGVKVRSG